MPVKYVSDFSFPDQFGFTGSSAGRADARSHPRQSSNEFGDGLKKGGPACMAKGGKAPVKKAMGGVQPPMAAQAANPIVGALQNPIARAAAAQVMQRQGGAPMGQPMAPSAGPATPMKKGGFLSKGIKHPGRMKAMAKREGIGLQAAEKKASHSSDPSLRAAGALGLRFSKGEFKHGKKG